MIETSASVKVLSQPLHSGRISPLFYGSFIELLDDHAPGLWAEMLNDRSFEGVEMMKTPFYYTGEPNVCDRKWDENDTWTYDNDVKFNGTRSARLTAKSNQPASITQSELASEKGMTYNFSGFFRTDNPSVTVEVSLKALLPDGTWMTMASLTLPTLSSEWKKYEGQMISAGTTDRAVFEIKVTGEGSVWADKLSIMRADNVKGWRKDVVEAIKNLNPYLIRWGGSLLDPGAYKWYDWIGNKDTRTPKPNYFWGRIDSQDVGIDEFLDFCEIVGTERMICISSLDTAESARDLVEYVNGSVDTEWGKKRAENGHPEPYNVKYWQAGNERDGYEYSEQALAICKAVRSVTPDAILLPAGPGPEAQEVMGEYLSFTCPHFYTDDLNYCEKTIIKTVKIANDLNPGKDIKAGITEWTIGNGPWGNQRSIYFNLKSALLGCQFLNILHKHSNIVGLACRSNMSNDFGCGILQTKPDTMYYNPSFYAMKLYSDNFLPVPVRMRKEGVDLDISACRSEDGKNLTIFAVNMNKEPMELQLDLSEYGTGFKPKSGQVVCDTLDQRQIEVMNHWSAPERIRTVDLDVTGETITLPAFSAAAIKCS